AGHRPGARAYPGKPAARGQHVPFERDGPRPFRATRLRAELPDDGARHGAGARRRARGGAGVTGRYILGPMRATLAAVCAALPSLARAQPADLVLRNGKIVTMNSATPVAQALAVRGDRIAALGSDADAAKWIGPRTQVIDLKGRLAIPGFIEGHGH